MFGILNYYVTNQFKSVFFNNYYEGLISKNVQFHIQNSVTDQKIRVVTKK